MRSKNEIMQKLEEVFAHRLEIRKNKFLSKHFKNCSFSVKEVINGSDVYFCVNQEVIKEKKIAVCDSENKLCSECNFFNCINTENSIKEQMLKEIQNLSICGIKEPKISTLMWVLSEPKEIKKGFISKISNWWGK